MVMLLIAKSAAAFAQNVDAVFRFWQNDTANSHLIITQREIAIVDAAVDSYWANRCAA